MLIAAITLTLAVSMLLLGRAINDEVVRLPVVLIGRFCLFLSLVYAPWLIKLLILVTIIVMPVCTQRYGLRQGRCSRLCIARSQCTEFHE